MESSLALWFLYELQTCCKFQKYYSEIYNKVSIHIKNYEASWIVFHQAW